MLRQLQDKLEKYEPYQYMNLRSTEIQILLQKRWYIQRNEEFGQIQNCAPEPLLYCIVL